MFSIVKPRCHVGMKTLAVNSLYVYAASTSAFIIVAPDSRTVKVQVC